LSAKSSAREDVWLRAALALVSAWTLSGAAVFVLRANAPGVAPTIAFLRQHDVERLASAERDTAMREAAKRLNQLSFAEIRTIRDSRAFFEFYRPLEPGEKLRMAELLVPRGVQRIVEASREVPPEQCETFLRKALYLATLELSTPIPTIDGEALERLQLEAVDRYIEGLSQADRRALRVQLDFLRQYGRPPP